MVHLNKQSDEISVLLFVFFLFYEIYLNHSDWMNALLIERYKLLNHKPFAFFIFFLFILCESTIIPFLKILCAILLTLRNYRKFCYCSVFHPFHLSYWIINRFNRMHLFLFRNVRNDNNCSFNKCEIRLIRITDSDCHWRLCQCHIVCHNNN